MPASPAFNLSNTDLISSTTDKRQQKHSHFLNISCVHYTEPAISRHFYSVWPAIPLLIFYLSPSMRTFHFQDLLYRKYGLLKLQILHQMPMSTVGDYDWLVIYKRLGLVGLLERLTDDTLIVCDRITDLLEEMEWVTMIFLIFVDAENLYFYEWRMTNTSVKSKSEKLFITVYTEPSIWHIYHKSDHTLITAIYLYYSWPRLKGHLYIWYWYNFIMEDVARYSWCRWH